MKENLKIFKITYKKSLNYYFFPPLLSNDKKQQLLQFQLLHSWPPLLYYYFPPLLSNNKEEQLLRLQLSHSWPPLFHCYVISKRIKTEQPAWSHFEDLSQSFLTVTDFAMFFSLDESESLKNILFRFFLCYCYVPFLPILASLAVFLVGVYILFIFIGKKELIFFLLKSVNQRQKKYGDWSKRGQNVKHAVFDWFDWSCLQKLQSSSLWLKEFLPFWIARNKSEKKKKIRD